MKTLSSSTGWSYITSNVYDISVGLHHDQRVVDVLVVEHMTERSRESASA